MKCVYLILLFLSPHVSAGILDTTLGNNCNPCEDSIARDLQYQSPIALSDAERSYIVVRRRQCLEFGKIHGGSKASGRLNSENESKQSGNADEDIKPALDIGGGFGNEYGGYMGLKVSYVVLKHLSVFLSLGNYFPEIGWNVGLDAFLLEKTRRNIFRPYAYFAYGMNDYLRVSYGYSDANSFGSFNGAYYGFYAGAGTEIRFGKDKTNGPDISIGFALPNDNFQKDLNSKFGPYAVSVEKSYSFKFALGYHVEF
jgi:hypothetical protein